MSFGDRDGAPVSEEIVFRAAQERLPDDWYVFHSFHFTSDDLQGRKKDGEIVALLPRTTTSVPCSLLLLRHIIHRVHVRLGHRAGDEEIIRQ